MSGAAPGRRGHPARFREQPGALPSRGGVGIRCCSRARALLLFQALGLLRDAAPDSPASLARRRREHWGSREEAATSYRKKALFRRFDPRVLPGLHHPRPHRGARRWLPAPPSPRPGRPASSRPLRTQCWRRLLSVPVPTLVLRGSESDTLTPGGPGARPKRTLPGVRAEELPGTPLPPGAPGGVRAAHPRVPRLGGRAAPGLRAGTYAAPGLARVSTRRSPGPAGG